METIKKIFRGVKEAIGYILGNKWVIILLLVLLAMFSFSTYFNNRLLKKDALAQAALYTDMQKKLTFYKDANDNYHARNARFEFDKKSYIDAHENEMDSMAKLLKIKTKQIDYFTKIASSNSGSVNTPLDTNKRIVFIPGENRYDTVEYYKFNYLDKWLTLDGIIDSGKITANYTMKDSLLIVGFTRREGFLNLGKKRAYIDVSSSNPNVTFSNLEHIELKDVKFKKFSLGVGVYYGFNGQKFQPVIGLGVQYKIFEF